MSDQDDVIDWATRTSLETLRAVEAGPDPLLVARELQKECDAQPEGEMMEIPADQLSRVILKPLIEEIERLREHREASEAYIKANTTDTLSAARKRLTAASKALVWR